MSYEFVQGLDYGPRRTAAHPNAVPLGLEYHMTEGNGGYGDVLYLARHAGETVAEWRQRVSGVSAHVVIVDDGRIVQMVDFDHVNGNLNPADRAGEYTYYGHRHLVDVLGSPQWQDPNVYSLSAEIAGKRDAGPTAAQVRSSISWGLDMKARYPSLRGAYGHHDQSTKPCPGTTPNMKAIFAGVGGHGLWSAEVDMPYEFKVERWKRNADGVLITTVGAPKKADGTVDYTSRLALLSGSDGTRRLDAVSRASITPVTAALDDTFYAALTAYAIPESATAVNAALDYVAGPATAVITAIHEARPR